MMTVTLAAGFFGLKKFKPCYLLLALSFGLLITGQFIKEKNNLHEFTESGISIP
ncbi:MAG: hypothetical protein GY940_05010, partial [bacterium]|nr:hypothetical protein [bacterium]